MLDFGVVGAVLLGCLITGLIEYFVILKAMQATQKNVEQKVVQMLEEGRTELQGSIGKIQEAVRLEIVQAAEKMGAALPAEAPARDPRIDKMLDARAEAEERRQEAVWRLLDLHKANGGDAKGALQQVGLEFVDVSVSMLQNPTPMMNTIKKMGVAMPPDVIKAMLDMRTSGVTGAEGQPAGQEWWAKI